TRETRTPNTTNMTFKGLDGRKLLKTMEGNGIYASSGAACTEGKTPSHVLLAMGRTPEEALSSIRFGLSRYNADGEIDYVVGSLRRIVSHLRTIINPMQRAVSQ
ncbi:MAG TPA: aminotransferase class V-fold PLP-dependent enzyme, partial [Candidatus Nanoarchaeia archaeon]|nr:aminotransferase class V-fold PLP-dependent enzyme [Candidatus Nanoarchaeia archaeon]